jgi:hypothetical protein
MILGIERVVDVRDLELGRFYLRFDYNEEPTVFQCVGFGEKEDGVPELRALWFAPQTQRPLGVEGLPSHGPIVALPEVHIRVDAPSMSGTNYTSNVRAGTFFISGDEAFIAVPRQWQSWSLINISTGRRVVDGVQADWVAFSRWLLVINDNGEEIPIASFGEDQTS